MVQWRMAYFNFQKNSDCFSVYKSQTTRNAKNAEKCTHKFKIKAVSSHALLLTRATTVVLSWWSTNSSLQSVSVFPCSWQFTLLRLKCNAPCYDCFPAHRNNKKFSKIINDHRHIWERKKSPILLSHFFTHTAGHATYTVVPRYNAFSFGGFAVLMIF